MEQNENQPPESDQRAVDLALRRYDTLIKYLIFENSLDWTRTQFFLAANSALLAIGANSYARKPADATGLIAPAVISILGLALSVIWTIAMSRSRKYSNRWKAVCIALEPLAFGDHEVHRNSPNLGLRKLARVTAALFIAVWSAALFIVVGVAITTFQNR